MYSTAATPPSHACGTRRHLWIHISFQVMGRAVRATAPMPERHSFFRGGSLGNVAPTQHVQAARPRSKRDRLSHGGWLTSCALRLRKPHRMTLPLTSHVAAPVLGRSAPRSPSRCSTRLRRANDISGTAKDHVVYRLFKAAAAVVRDAWVGSMFDSRRVDRRMRSVGDCTRRSAPLRAMRFGSLLRPRSGRRSALVFGSAAPLSTR